MCAPFLGFGCSPDSTERLGAEGERCRADSDCQRTLACNAVCFDPAEGASPRDEPMSQAQDPVDIETQCEQFCASLITCDLVEADVYQEECNDQFEDSPEEILCSRELACNDLIGAEAQRCFNPNDVSNTSDTAPTYRYVMVEDNRTNITDDYRGPTSMLSV